jgi:hypothetical protein
MDTATQRRGVEDGGGDRERELKENRFFISYSGKKQDSSGSGVETACLLL